MSHHPTTTTACRYSPTPSLAPLLARWSAGDTGILDALLPTAYEPMRRIARNLLRCEPAARGLEPEALVHEVYLDLACRHRPGWRGERHFYAVVALLMRRRLVDRARRRRSSRRGGGWRRLSLDVALLPVVAPSASSRTLSVSQALRRLHRSHRRAARVVVLRTKFGLTVSEIAALLGVGPATVTRDWRGGCEWLRQQLRHRPQSVAGRPAWISRRPSLITSSRGSIGARTTSSMAASAIWTSSTAP